MSGPKRGIWRIPHNPIPQRLRDLEGFRQRLEEWLTRQASFLEQNLGPAVLVEARAAIDRVAHCIKVADPRSGFDAYGAARQRFNALWEQARTSRGRQRSERQEQHRLAEERRRLELLEAQRRRMQPQNDRGPGTRRPAGPQGGKAQPVAPYRPSWRSPTDANACSTQQRLKDLESCRLRLEDWLSRQSSFLEQNLGPGALVEARAAIDDVTHCIQAADPQSGFDAYGAARGRFNELWEQARENQDRRRRERREERLEEARRNQERQDTERRRLQHRCDQDQSEHKDAEPKGNKPKAVAPLSAPCGPSSGEELHTIQPGQTGSGSAAAKDQKSTERIARGLSRVREAFDRMAEWDLSSLPADRQEQVRAELDQCQREIDQALEREDEEHVASSLSRLDQLGADLKQEMQAAQLDRAADLWKQGLGALGYSVGERRTDPDGTIVLEAMKFPMSSIRIGLQAGSQEVALNVNGEHDSVECVKDLDSLQRVLGQYGLELTVTDWGRGHPNDVFAQHETHETHGRC